MSRGKHGNHARASAHPRWTAEKMLSSHGYVRVRVGRSHPLADPNGYAYEHHLVLAAAGIDIPAGHIVHHRNHDKTDNRIENLEVTTRGQHNAHHNASRRRDARGRFVPVVLDPMSDPTFDPDHVTPGGSP